MRSIGFIIYVGADAHLLGCTKFDFFASPRLHTCRHGGVSQNGLSGDHPHAKAH